MKLHDSIFNFWYWKAVVNHKLFFTKVSVRFFTSLPVCFQGFQKKMCCQHWAHLFWVKNTTNLYVIIFHDTVPYIDWIWRKSKWLIAFDLEIPANLEFLVVVSSVLYHISQIKGSDFLLCHIFGPTPELLCPFWGFTIWGVPEDWKGPCKGQPR